VIYKKWDVAKRKGTRIINLGQKPTVVTYSLVGNQLISTDILNPTDPPVVVSDAIVQFQVQYAFDFNGDGIVASDAPMVATLTGTADQWADALPTNPTTAMWAGIVGIRFAVVSRSVTPEKPDPATGVCATTTALNAPKWLATGRTLDVSANANWMCYRYRVFEVTVPARNIAWLPDEGV
jgi:type IV pilus assembly protein PilW